MRWIPLPLIFFVLAACAPSGYSSQTHVTVTLPPPPTETPIPKPTFDPDFNQKTLFPGVDPQQFLGQTASEGRQITLPQDVFAYLRQHHLAPLQDSQGFVSRVSGDGVCSVMFPDHLVDSGAALKAVDVAGGQAVFAVNGTESVGQFRFQVPDGVSCVASVAQAGSGFAEGTVLVTLFQNDGKAGAEVLNEEPLRVIADEPNKITFVSLENGFKLVTTDADGNVIEEQSVDIDIVSGEQISREIAAKLEGRDYEIENNQVIVNGEAWYKFDEEIGQWRIEQIGVVKSIESFDDLQPIDWALLNDDEAILAYLEANEAAGRYPRPDMDKIVFLRGKDVALNSFEPGQETQMYKKYGWDKIWE